MTGMRLPPLAAAVLLAYNGDPRIIPKLIESAADPDSRIRETAIDSLGWRSVLDARPVSVAALKDPDPKVRETAERRLTRIDWIVRAREVRYHPPSSTPYGKGTRQEAEYLKAHHAAWNFVIASLEEASIDAGKPTGSGATACEAIASVTAGWYAGATDVSNFLKGVRKRMESDAGAKEQLKVHRQGV